MFLCIHKTDYALGGCKSDKKLKNSFFQYLHPISGRSNATDSGTVFGMTLALNIIKEFHVMCHFYVPKIKKMHF